MSGREFKPGDVALVTCHDEGRISILVSDSGGGRKWWAADGYHYANRPNLTARPLLVLDPDSHEQMERLWEVVERENSFVPYADAPPKHDDPTHARATAAAVRSLLEPPKPPEPQGLGAVVEDASGVRYTRARSRPAGSACWWRDASDVVPIQFARIDVARVISEGASA